MSHYPLLLGFADYREQAKRIANELSTEYLEIQTHYFPDNEVSITLPPHLPEQVIFCRSLNKPNDKLIELLLASQTAREAGVRNITLIAPYLCYMRQDIAFHPGEAVSQKIIGGLLASLFDAIVTVDPHLHRTSSLDLVFPGTRTLCLSAAPLIGDFIAQDFQDAVIIGPDEESLQWISVAAKSSGFPYSTALKTRNGDRDVEISLPEVNFNNKNVILLDDIISSGHTIAQASMALKTAGARHIHTIVTHALFDKNSQKLLTDSGVENILSTDSVPHPSNAINLAPLIASGIKTLIGV